MWTAKIHRFNQRTLDVRLRDLDCEFEQISVQAVDEAGNKSKTVQVKNPDYEKEQEKEQDSGKDSGNTSNSEDTKEETKPEASDQKPASSAGDSTQKPEQAASAAGSSTPSADTSKPAASASTDPEQTSDTEPHDPTPLTPDGQGTVRTMRPMRTARNFIRFPLRMKTSFIW